MQQPDRALLGPSKARSFVVAREHAANRTISHAPSAARSAVRLVLLGLFLAFVCSCADYSAYIEEGHQNLKAGRFDAAFGQFQKASGARNNDPRLLGGMGLVLSLKRISIPAAIRLLEKSLALGPDDDVRRELLRLYVDMGFLEDARSLVRAPKISNQKMFAPDIKIMQLGVDCIASPGTSYYNLLEKYAPDRLRDFFLVRCLLAGKENKKALAAFKNLKDDLTRCELVASWPLEKIEADAPSASDCSKRFPGSIYLNRERPPNAAALKEQPLRKLYEEETEFPPYPEDPWRYVERVDLQWR